MWAFASGLMYILRVISLVEQLRIVFCFENPDKMIKALVPEQRGNSATADILADFGRFLRLHAADGDAGPAAVRSYYGNAAQFVA